MAYTYAYLIKPVSDLHSADLVKEAAELQQELQRSWLPSPVELIAASVTIYKKEQPIGGGAEALMVPANNRGAVAWGSDALWYDAKDMDDLLIQFCEEE